jgi:hypothetical protein
MPLLPRNASTTSDTAATLLHLSEMRSNVPEKEPSVAQVEALAVGRSSLTLFDATGKLESVDVVAVKPDRSMKVGEKLPLRAATGKPMVRLEISSSDRAKIRRNEDQWILNRGEHSVVAYKRNEGKSYTTIIEMGNPRRHLLLGDLNDLFLEAVEPGLVRLVLTDGDSKTEALDILVTPK